MLQKCHRLVDISVSAMMHGRKNIKKVVTLKQKICPYLVSDPFTTFLQWLFRVFLSHTIPATVSVKEDRNTVHDIERKRLNGLVHVFRTNCLLE